jgi:hypothetical protein
MLLLLLLGLCLPAAVDEDAPNPDVSRNHDVYRFCREWSCFEGQADVKRMVSRGLVLGWLKRFVGALLLPEEHFPVVVDPPPPEEEVPNGMFSLA